MTSVTVTITFNQPLSQACSCSSFIVNGFWNYTGSASDHVFGPDISEVVTAAPAPPTAVTTPPTPDTPPPGHTPQPPTASSPTTSHGGVSLAWPRRSMVRKRATRRSATCSTFSDDR